MAQSARGAQAETYRTARVDSPGALPLPDIGEAEGRAMEALSRLATRRSSALGRFAAWVFGSLFTLVISVAAWNFVTGLFATNEWLGWVALGLTVTAGVSIGRPERSPTWRAR